MNCIHCGEQVVESAKFCAACGEKIQRPQDQDKGQVLESAATSDMKTCRYCKEVVKPDATLCPHCRKNIGPGAALQEFGLGAMKLGCALTFLGPVVLFLFVLLLASC